MWKVGIGFPPLGLGQSLGAVVGPILPLARSKAPRIRRLAAGLERPLSRAPVPGSAPVACLCRAVVPTRVPRRPTPASARVSPADHPTTPTGSSGHAGLRHFAWEAAALGPS